MPTPTCFTSKIAAKKEGIRVFLTLLATVGILLWGNLPGTGQQKKHRESRDEFIQLPHGSLVALSTEGEGIPGATVSFPFLAQSSEAVLLPTFKAHGVTHLLLTSRDIYLHLTIYGDSVSFVETEDGFAAYRYASQNPESKTSLLTAADERLSGIYLAVDDASNQLTNVVCEFLSENETLRLPPKEIFFKGQSFRNKTGTCPYILFINADSANPFDWTIVCVPANLRNAIAIKLYLLDESSEFFVPLHAFNREETYIKVWQVK